MIAALTPVFAAFTGGDVALAQVDPCEIIPDPPPDLCPPSSSPSASASRSASQSASTTRSPSTTTSPSSTTSASSSPTTSSSPSQTASSSPSATRTASTSPSATRTTSSPTPTISPSRTPQTFTGTTQVSIKFKRRKSRFSGRLSSNFDECEAGRQMSLFYVVPGFNTARRVGKGTSKPNGRWSIKERKADGTYFAVAKRRQVSTTAGDTIDCRKGKSKRKKV